MEGLAVRPASQRAGLLTRCDLRAPFSLRCRLWRLALKERGSSGTDLQAARTSQNCRWLPWRRGCLVGRSLPARRLTADFDQLPAETAAVATGEPIHRRFGVFAHPGETRHTVRCLSWSWLSEVTPSTGNDPPSRHDLHRQHCQACSTTGQCRREDRQSLWPRQGSRTRSSGSIQRITSVGAVEPAYRKHPIRATGTRRVMITES